MYSKPNCGFGDKARKVLADSKIPVKEVDLEKLKSTNAKEGTAIINGRPRSSLFKLWHFRSCLHHQTDECPPGDSILVWPNRILQIFICGKFVGGYTELNQLKENGRLLETVNECAHERD